jgi:hypothetical protein
MGSFKPPRKAAGNGATGVSSWEQQQQQQQQQQQLGKRSRSPQISSSSTALSSNTVDLTATRENQEEGDGRIGSGGSRSEKILGLKSRTTMKRRHVQRQAPSSVYLQLRVLTSSECLLHAGASGQQNTSPSPLLCLTPSPHPHSTSLQIPNQFYDLESYAHCFVSLMMKEMQSSLNSFSHELWRAALSVGTRAASGEDGAAPNCKCGRPAKLVVSKSAKNPNRAFFTCDQGDHKNKKKKIVGKVEEVVVEEVEEVAFMEQVEGMEEMQLPARGVTTLSGSISWIKRRR